MRIRAKVQPDQSIAVQVSYDPSWHAYADGRSLNIHKDAFGFMRIAAPAGANDIRLVFELPLENLLGRILTLISAVLTIGLIVLGVLKDNSQIFTGLPASDVVD